MTVTAAEARLEYLGNGSTTVFSYPYQFYQNDDLDVWLYDADGNGHYQILNTDYTVIGALDPSGGSVTMTVAPAADTTLIIINNPDIVQINHYVNADDFPAESHEQALDRLTKICQRLSDRVDRAVRAPDYAPENSVPDADTLVELVDQATAAANDAESSATESATQAVNAQNSASAAATSAANAFSSASDADASADAAAASATAAQVAEVDWKGPWNSGTTYMKNDAVNSGGSSYISKTDNNLNNLPPNATHWDILAQKGSDGGGAGTGDMLSTNNLSDVADVPTSRNNLGLGDAATLDVGTAAGTVMAGDDPRVVGAAPLASPVFSGNPQAPTPSPGDNDTSIATTGFVFAALAAFVPSSIADGAVSTAAKIADGIITFAKMATAALATAAQFRANVADKLLATDKVWSAAAPVTLTDGATVTPDFAGGFDFIWTLGAVGRTLANPSNNNKPGQKGLIYLVQDGTGSRTITTWGSQYKFAGGTKPVLTTTANAVDVLSYAVKSATEIECFFSADFK